MADLFGSLHEAHWPGSLQGHQCPRPGQTPSCLGCLQGWGFPVTYSAFHRITPHSQDNGVLSSELCAMYCDGFYPVITSFSCHCDSYFHSSVLSHFTGRSVLNGILPHWKNGNSAIPSLGKIKGLLMLSSCPPHSYIFPHTMISLQFRLWLTCCSGGSTLFFIINSRLTVITVAPVLRFNPLYFSVWDTSSMCKEAQMYPKNPHL